VLMQMLPAVAEQDLPAFGAAVTEMQARTGDYFAPAQGGQRFASAAVAATIERLAGEGAVGIGQSSWGPTGYAFAPSVAAAQAIVERVRRHAAGAGVDIRICKGLNGGAHINAAHDAPQW
jgi:beta-ribofuranosylaminobenzene 5'-phosphate synthase